MLLNALPAAAASIDKAAPHEEASTGTPAGKPGGTGTIRTRHAALKQLEALARVELQELRSTHRDNDASVVDDSLIWLGLAWDMGLTGCNIAEVTPPESSTGLAAAQAASAAVTALSPGTDEVVPSEPC